MTTLIDDSETILRVSAEAAGDAGYPLADRFWTQAQGVADALAALHRPSIGRSLTAALVDWLLIFGGLGAVVVGGVFVTPFALILIGNRQRALADLLHDASHGSFAGSGRRADRLANCLLFLPLCTMRTLDGREPSVFQCADDGMRGGAGPLWRHMTDARIWTGSILGHAWSADARARAGMLVWWGAVLLAIALILRPSDALLFAALWLGSRATSFHLITTFREIPAAGGLLGILLHPHNNGYRLARHLHPDMPFFALPRAHALLMRSPDYAAAAQHERSVFDPGALLRSWLRRPTASQTSRVSPGAARPTSPGDAKHLIDLLYPATGPATGPMSGAATGGE
jgi:hypothetical protein